MDAEEQVKRVQVFFDENYKADILSNVSQGKAFVVVDFSRLALFEPALAEALLNAPEETIRAAELAVEQFDLPSEVRFKVRFSNLPKSHKVMVRDIRSEHIGRLLCVEGLVRQKSDVRPQAVASRFECPSCGNVISVLQLDSSFKEPSSCGCGRKGKFHLLSKELVDAQGIVLEENPEDIEGGAQPKRINVFLKEDLVSPWSERKTNPGSRVIVTGMIKEVPIVLRSGGKSTRFDLLLEANWVEAAEESFYEMKISKGEEEQIKLLASDPHIYEKLVSSIAPSIYGYEQIKEALVLQLFGGVSKTRADGVRNRGDVHVLLVGDPGCISGDSKVSLLYKGMEEIQNLGSRHLQPIREVVTKIRRDSKDKCYDFATVFQHYPKQPVLRVVTETGKEVVCTYNQPFLTKEGWERADELLLGTKIRVMPKIPSRVKKLAPANFVRVEKRSGHLKEVALPEKFTPELASLCGYIIGDGNIHPGGYRLACYVNDEEKDLIGKLSDLCITTFGIEPAVFAKSIGGTRTIDDGSGLLRQIISTQQVYVLEINSRQVAQSLSFLSDKRVPAQVFKSPKQVMARFVSWLFEADGCAFGNGRGRTSIQLKSKTIGLLRDVQLLLLYFGVQSRIIGDNLCIRRSRDMELFAKHIGFNSEKKRAALNRVLDAIKRGSEVQKRKAPQRYERVVKIVPEGVRDVYDFEVPVSHTFIANGIVCHNSGKSALLKRVGMIAPKGRYVAGKGASAAGLTASVVKDEFLGGWSLEAGALVLANNGLVCIDEMDKMGREDRSAMHEALEQQTVSVSKANIQATLLARTTVLAAANPKFGRFDPYGIIAEQIDLPPTLINRFDLIFPIKDVQDAEKDEKMAKHMLGLHQTPELDEAEIGTELLRRYIAYAKRRRPVLTDGAIDEIKTFYVNMRSQGTSEERVVRSIPISPRQLEALVRLSEAVAKVRLADKVVRKDVKRATSLLTYCLMQVGLDRETGQIDIDRIATSVPASQRSRIFNVKEIIAELESKLGRTIPIEDVMRAAAEKGLKESDVEDVIEKLREIGDIYEPRKGFLTRL